jgi:primosomal protein N' (replication factor Y)
VQGFFFLSIKGELIFSQLSYFWKKKMNEEMAISDSLHQSGQTVYGTVILPLALDRLYTYRIPPDLVPQVKRGIRVEVSFGKKKRYAAIIYDLHTAKPEGYSPKQILSIIDEKPLIHSRQIDFWTWLSTYYCCSLGEIMQAALPSNLKLSSESLIVLLPELPFDPLALPDKEYLIIEALSGREYLHLEDIQDMLGIKTVYPTVRSLIEKGFIEIKEELKDPYKPQTVFIVHLQEPYLSQQESVGKLFEKIHKFPKQEQLLLAFFLLRKEKERVTRKDLLKKAGVEGNVLLAMVRKNIFQIEETPLRHLWSGDLRGEEKEISLTPKQEEAYKRIKEYHLEHKVVLLQGITGSGKTRIYMKLMQEVISRGGQVLYLLPEIALSNQVTGRLQAVFQEQVLVYHSRLSDKQRVESWQRVKEGKSLIVGARSSLFLPFSNLMLVIVDEEHDPSYKQNEPNPRYQGRDAAIYLAHIWKAQVILGTATPSLETYYHSKSGKYGRVMLDERYGGTQLPEVSIISLVEEKKNKRMIEEFSETLLERIKEKLANKEQVILFQNRRGFAPTLRCSTCGWHAECVYCDVSLTYHKSRQGLKCHYCGYFKPAPTQCPACGSKEIALQGFGTEKIEAALQVILPEARIGRMDFDTVKSKFAHNRLIQEFEDGDLDILIGTQMVTKGLDFSNVGLVGILSSDQLMHYPDFRSSERAFQLITQVSGRAGRRTQQGQVMIQAMNLSNPVLLDVLENQTERYYERELSERAQFQYPPFQRLIKISLKHVDFDTVHNAAILLKDQLQSVFGNRIKGPAVPYIGRIRNSYLMDFLLKLDHGNQRLQEAKNHLSEAQQKLRSNKLYSSVRFVVDVDPH